MKVIADLHIHSKYSRAVSQEMTIPKIWEWGKRKGIGLVSTGDWTHPLWIREIKKDLEEMGNGLLRIMNQEDGPYFLLTTEISSIYSQGGKARRIHNLIWSPSIETADKINKELITRGANLISDGRPIVGLTSIEIAELVFTIDSDCLMIPAHCLILDSLIQTNGNNPKAIQDIQEGDLVLTHKGRFKKVEKVLSRDYSGDILQVKPWYFSPGLIVTPEHPFLAIKTIKRCPSTGDICRPSEAHLKRCKRRTCLQYKKEWIIASKLESGDMLVYPRQKEVVRQKSIQISKILSGFVKDNKFLRSGGTRGRKIPDEIDISDDFGRLIGYYLAEGYTDNRDSISFCFNREEKQYIDDVKSLIKKLFGIDKCREYQRKDSQSIELIFFSKILSKWFAQICYCDQTVRKAHTKKIPDFLLITKYSVQAEIIRGWYRGDKGYTSSRVLMNQLKMLFVRLGMIPSVMIDTSFAHKRRRKHELDNREVSARHDSFYFSGLAFFDNKFNLRKEIPRSQTKSSRRHGWVDDDYIYIPVKKIKKKKYKGKVYNLEVEKDHSYTAEFACVHNCWTPWFSLYGSESGFDSIDECFGRFAKYIYAIETGLSSDPSMNWRIKELDSRSILSFSDAHSGPKLGREMTMFDLKELSYSAIREVIIGKKLDNHVSSIKYQVLSKDNNNQNTPNTKYVIPNIIAYTIEFHPEEGKYHYTGHRNCGIKQDPTETKKKGVICPVCGRKLTIGVMHRVEQLAGRSEEELRIKSQELWKNGIKGISSEAFPERPPFVKMVPLMEILAEAIGVSSTSKRVVSEYQKLTDVFGNEFKILLQIKTDEIGKVSGPKAAEAIDKVRSGNIVVDPGYDGVFGVVKIWPSFAKASEGKKEKEQMSLF